jgi:hypothetical protein
MDAHILRILTDTESLTLLTISSRKYLSPRRVKLGGTLAKVPREESGHLMRTLLSSYLHSKLWAVIQHNTKSHQDSPGAILEHHTLLMRKMGAGG